MNHLIAALAALSLATAPVVDQPTGNPRADALFDQGFELLFGTGASEESRAKALKPLEEAASLGHGGALNTLGVMYLNGIGVTADPVRAASYFEQAVSAGDPAARFNLGAQLALSKEAADHTRAFELLERAYQNPDFRHRVGEHLAVLHLFGRGTPRDIPQGVRILLDAEKNIDVNADTLFLLGRAYESGWGDARPDDRKALSYFERSAHAGHPHAAWKAGMYYLQGKVTPRDERHAAELVRKAAEGGDLSGSVSWAVMLATGEGVAEDDAAARGWYRRAAEEGSAHALRGLGGMLLNGEGGAVDRVQGLAYVELAAEAGDVIAVNAMRTLRDQIAPDELGAIETAKAFWVGAHGRPEKVEP